LDFSASSLFLWPFADEVLALGAVIHALRRMFIPDCTLRLLGLRTLNNHVSSELRVNLAVTMPHLNMVHDGRAERNVFYDLAVFGAAIGIRLMRPRMSLAPPNHKAADDCPGKNDSAICENVVRTNLEREAVSE